MKMSLENLDEKDLNMSIKLKKVNDYSELIDGTYSIELQRKLIETNIGKCDTFLLEGCFEQKPIGICSVMYKNGDELEYKVRNIDAFIYNVRIDSTYRGKGYAKEMLLFVGMQLKYRGINDMYLAVSTDNTSAIKAYKKTGFEIVSEKYFIRMLRKNIPYYTI